MTKKPSFGPNCAQFGPNSVRQILVSNIWLRQSLDIKVSYYHAQYQKKLMIQSWEYLVTDGQAHESYFIGRCPTNVKRPI